MQQPFVNLRKALKTMFSDGTNLFANTDGVHGNDFHVVIQGDKLTTTDIIFV